MDWLLSVFPNTNNSHATRSRKLHVQPAKPWDRRNQAFQKRLHAARIAKSRNHPNHKSNGDEDRYDDGCDNLTFIASFTKGLPHDADSGIISSAEHFDLFVDGINSGKPSDFKKIPLGPQITPLWKRFQSGIARASNLTRMADVRAWESMGAGLLFSLQGPDSQAVTMPPAPKLESDELVSEMVELYWMALLRDLEFVDFEKSDILADSVISLNDTLWVKLAQECPNDVTHHEKKRLRGPFTPQTIFRGNTPGDEIGPYISQFLLAGNSGIDSANSPDEGFIQYGAIRINQRVRVATPDRNYMTTWEAFIDVQNGADVRGRGTYVDGSNTYRFITTPRDLCTYVHFDALYQAYLNACILMLGMGIPFDSGIPFQEDDDVDKQQGFAHFGGPHILTLVTEVATRALKAVRFQKYNIHRRLRPEAVGGLIERFHYEPDNPKFLGVKYLYSQMDKDLLNRVSEHNIKQNELSDFGRPRTEDFFPEGCSGVIHLLPMAFPEGSPMHPSYGAGHATVAGACVTILKAFFDHKATFPFVFVPDCDGERLKDVREECGIELTVEGELNKLCSNISIGRGWAGVHYFSDYRESIVMGEKIALGILQEQKITYHEPFSMTVPLFDGTEVTI